MVESEGRAAPPRAKLPPLSPSLTRHSDGFPSTSSLGHVQRSPPQLHAPPSKLPPPMPTRLHSYHHPISASYASSNSSLHDRNRQPPPPLWHEHRSPPLEHRSSDFSRHLPPLSSSSSSSNSATSALPSSASTNAFQLPSLSASLPSSTSWHGREAQRAPSLHATSFRTSRDPSAANLDSRKDTKLPSLSGHFGDQHAPRPPASDAASAGLVSPSAEEPSPAARKPAKAHVPSACLNCKRAHLACDVGRPCRRCINLGKSDTCIDVQHKKRDAKSDVSGSPASASYARQSPGSESGYFRSPTRTSELLSPPLLSSSAAVMHVSGATHGSSMHPRSASNSVSASSYPFSRPDHLRRPTDTASHAVSHAASSWSYQPASHAARDTPAHTLSPPLMGARQHSHSLSYEHHYPYYHPQHAQQHQQQHQQQHSQPSAHGHAHHASASSSGMYHAGAGTDASDAGFSAVVTMICSTNLQCARISDEVTALLGYQPSELNERSLFELVHPSETSRLQEIWTSLIDPVGVVPQAVPAAAEVVMSTPAARLMTPAAGTIFVQENMRLRQRNGMYDFYSVRLHLGGGFGVDLYRRDTLDRAYIVASLLKLGNDAVHPEPALLRSPYSNDAAQSGGFRTPSAGAAPAQSRAGTGRWEADEAASMRAPPHTAQSPDARDAKHADEPAHQASDSASRGVKRSSADMDEDEPDSSSQTAPPPSAPASNGAAASSAYGSSKHAVYSPPPAMRSMLSERSRGTSRDGILC
ncbi:uncharacterized protein PAN0_021d6001 [Moesziomyces antarcticus]|uniref:Transcription activator of gluconeogenesis ERT1 n=1 Tax=Pseudozyma antarctica TaxID=84753 RepID=A0A081CM76_PSEA2|nr:uncharacterized protein PAN0_021d6001 [Moesziomyces antarcticus]GAK67772.1 conserved hypothetical protein [Moesziomyces antarcticus]